MTKHISHALHAACNASSDKKAPTPCKTRLLMAALTLATVMGAQAQVPGGALNYMLQRPRVAKSYDHKRPFDHLFLDAGVGMNMLAADGKKGGMQGELNLGDWITPEHGVRLNLNTGIWQTQSTKAKYFGLGLDYMLNITALAQRGTRYTPRPFEVYGIAGLDYAYSRHMGHSERGIGTHIAMRGQLALSRSTYFYMEPRVTWMDDDATQCYSWHGYRPVVTANIGFGYRLPEPGTRRNTTDSLAVASPANGLFLTAMVGPTFMFNYYPETWHRNTGERLTVAVGKWFDPYNAVRLGANAITFMQNDTHRIKAVGLQLDYMLNLHNAFIGVNPYRPFWLNAVVGGSFTHVDQEPQIPYHNTWGVGVGLQANIRLSDAFTITVEPRADLYEKDFAPQVSSYKHFDLMPSLMVGLTYNYTKHVNAKSINDTPYAPYSTIGGAFGVANRMLYAKSALNYMPAFRLSYTHWYGADGWRASMGGMIRRARASYRWAKATVGADWLADLTAHSYGYDPDRVLSVVLLAGANAGVDYARGKSQFAPDIHAGGQLRLNLGGNVVMVGEMQMEYMLGSQFSGQRDRAMPQAMLGFEYAMRRPAHRDPITTPTQRNVVTASAGTSLFTGSYSQMSPFGRKLQMVTTLGYGRWLSGMHGVYGEVSNSVVQRRGKGNQNITSLTAAYMLDAKAAVTGLPTANDVFQTTAIVGPTIGISSRKDHDTKVVMGIHAALQAGWRVTDNLELYVEPSATVYSKKIEPHSPHPAEGELKLSVGAKVHF